MVPGIVGRGPRCVRPLCGRIGDGQLLGKDEQVMRGSLPAIVLLLVVPSLAWGQRPRSPGPLEPSDTSSPRATLASFIRACNELYEVGRSEDRQRDPRLREKLLPITDRILDCLDLSGLPAELHDSAGVTSAVYLKEVLDRIELPPLESIPGPQEVKSGQGSESLRVWQLPGTRLLIVRVEQGPFRGQYRFSAETVRRAARFYSAVKGLPYRTTGPKTSPGLLQLHALLTRRQPKLATDTSSPRGTLMLFLTEMNELFETVRTLKYVDRTDPKYVPQVMRILGCLDVSQVPEYYREEYAAEAAVCLKEVLDRVELPPAEEIPGPEDLESSEGTEPLTHWQVPNTRITIVRMPEGPRKGEYLFSAGTVQRAPLLYQRMRALPYRKHGPPVSPGFYQWWLSTPGHPAVAQWVESLPPVFRSRFYQLALWQWIGLAVTSVAALALMVLLYRLGWARGTAIRQQSLFRYWFTLLFPVLAMCVPLAFKYVVWKYLTILGQPLYTISFVADLFFLLGLIVVILSFSNRLADSVVAMRSIQKRGVDVYLVRILSRALGLVAAAVVFLEGGRYLGLPITTLLASAGIGGLAVALSAQGMIKGIFGTMTILMDKPYRVGERIIVKDYDGVVEEIGLRSTKLRQTLTNHIISIPNDLIADAEIVNVGRRRNILRRTDLRIPLTASREKVLQAVEAIRQVLKDHEGMDPDYPPRVYFNEFNPDSFNIRIMYWYSPPDVWAWYAFTERVNLEICRIFEEQQIPFSMPQRHTFWREDYRQGPLDVRLVSDAQPPGDPEPNVSSSRSPHSGQHPA